MWLSASSKAESRSSTPSSAPMASPCLIALRALSGPSVITVIFVPAWRSRMRSAASTACSSNGLMTSCKPGAGTIRFACSSIRNMLKAASGLGTCFAQTTICITVRSAQAMVTSVGTMPSKCLRW
jgi:hypothetical protein